MPTDQTGIGPTTPMGAKRCSRRVQIPRLGAALGTVQRLGAEA
jgi:hypothetical protein